MDKIIQSIIDKYKLTFIEYLRAPDKGIIRSHVLKCANEEGEHLILKVFESSDTYARERFINELRHVKAIRSKIPNKFKKFMPKVKFHDLEGVNPFYAYDFSEGKKLGSFITDFGITHGNFTHSNFSKFIEFVDIVGDLDLGTEYSTSRWSINNARKEVKYYLENTKDLFSPDLYDRIINFYEDNKDKAFKKFVYSHRDMYPENILIEAPFSSKFTFLDWEYFSKVPMGFTAAFIYLMFWREEFWKAKTFAHFYNKYERLDNGKHLSAFLDSFIFCVVILSIRFLYQIQAFADKETESAFHARRSFLFDLDRALNSDIVKPRSIKFYVNEFDMQKVADEFRIGQVSSYEIFYASKGNTVAKVDTIDGHKYIFRFYSDSRTRELIKRELKIFEKLRNAGISTYEVMHTKKKRSILDINMYGKTRRVAVLSYLQGKKLLRKWANKKSALNLASTLAQIHDCDVIHGDFSKENVLFKRDKVVGVIDFEWGNFTKSKEIKKHDTAKAIALWMTDIRNKVLSDEELYEAFLEGYYKRSLANEEKVDMLELVMAKIQAEKEIFVTTIDMSTRKTSVRRFDEILKKLRVLMLSYKA